MMSAALLWKEEPVSPLSSEEADLFDDTFYHTPLEETLGDVKWEDDELDGCETKAEVASQILENLENLMDLDDLIKDEPFLLDEKMLPLLDEVQAPCGAVAVPVNFKSERMFDSLTYDIVELSANSTAALTPPQSPPQEHSMLTNLDLLTAQQPSIYLQQQRADLDKATIYSLPDKPFASTQQQSPPTSALLNLFATPPQSYGYVTMTTPQHDVAHELAVVDELVRTRVEDMQWNSSSGPSSPDSSNHSNFGDCSSSSEDPEWAPESIGDFDNTLPNQFGKVLHKKRSKLPKDPADKKSRKKEQNKNAATRYRMKKKAEVEVILTEEKILLGVNSELNGKITDIQREIKYLKGLMRDLFKAKGVIN